MDKVTVSNHGDPSSALLEVLDPEPVSYTHLDVYKRQVQRLGVGFVLDFRFGIEHVEDAFTRSDTLVDIGELVDEREYKFFTFARRSA